MLTVYLSSLCVWMRVQSVYWCVCACVFIGMEARGWHRVSFSVCLHLFVETVSVIKIGASQARSACLSLQYWDYRHQPDPVTSGFLMQGRGMELRPQVCMANTLPTGTAPQPHFSIFPILIVGLKCFYWLWKYLSVWILLFNCLEIWTWPSTSQNYANAL